MQLRRISILLAAALASALTACGGGKPPATEATQPTAAPASAEPAAPTAATGDVAAATAGAAGGDVAAMVAAADVTRGKTMFLQCRACHSLTPESEPGKIGPTLYGVIGRQAGSVAGFEYSEVVAKSGKVWTVEEIDHWIARPSEYLPGNKMVFIGMPKAEDRAAVIAYIQQESAKPAGQ